MSGVRGAVLLFNSFEFVFGFLPAMWLIYFAAARLGGAKLAIWTLSLGSMAFYAWWNPLYLLLIVGEIVLCFQLGRALTSQRLSLAPRRWLLVLGIAIILAVLGYFKYTDFLLETLNETVGTRFAMLEIVLPLGISFHSFQQIAYLADAYAGRAPRYEFSRYSLFVTFFPQLIAGPIVHHHEVIPQLGRSGSLSPQPINVATGLAVFAVGLFKKTVIADSLAQIAVPIFAAAKDGQILTATEAWYGALGYSLQLYFDFSAYSDMAIGLALMFNLRLPINFFSPYKATSIADFWRRWHMSLSRFLRDYLYIPLGGSRRGPTRTCINLMITMLLGGLWHGAGWTFAIWGGLHGLYLLVQSLWRLGTGGRFAKLPLYRLSCWMLTLLAVVIAWVFFRADRLDTALRMLQSMFLLVPESFHHGTPHFEKLLLDGWKLIALTGAIALVAPNTYQIFRRYRPALPTYPYVRTATPVTPASTETLGWILQPAWRPSWRWSLLIGLTFGAAIIGIAGWHAEFLYFQF
jgi:D-alanyl-lipoteichoic acid acyltransferase DltB (MBOAT superfamily)